MAKNTEIEMRGVKVGDKFINPSHRKSKIISTVTDILEVRSMVTGEVVRHEVIATHSFLGQKLSGEVAFSTVARNRV